MSTSAPLTALETFREVFGLMPWFFYQLASPSTTTNPLIANAGGECNPLTWEYAWAFKGQDGAGRRDIRLNLWQTEQRLKEYLRYSVGAHWTSETLDVGIQPYGEPALLNLSEGKLRQIGTRTWELIQNVPVVVTDDDGDGIYDTFNATVSMPSGVSTSDLTLFFLPADQIDGKDDQDWQIKPVTFTQDGTDLKIKCRSWLLVKPVLYEGYRYKVGYSIPADGDSSGALNPNTAGNYVTEVGLYKSVVSSDNEATLTCDDCGTLTTATVCATILNRETGQVALKVGETTTGTCPACGWGWYGGPLFGGNGYVGGTPRRVTISYEAGDDLNKWKLAVCRMAAAEMMRKVCGCDSANYELLQWQMDSADKDGRFKPSERELASPLGTKRGHIYAWNQVMRQYSTPGYTFAF
jgi:hypothetical protein